jgi:diadenylate cyclase
LERILRGRTGALIVLGHDALVESLCDGGFALDVSFAPTRLRELSKMDGAIVLSDDGSRILRANVQMVPDPKIPTEESGTRHRAAERTAIQTGYPVVSVSASMSIVSVYVDGVRHVLEGSPTILSRANQAVATLERYKMRLDEVTRALSAAEIEDFVSLRDAMTVVQRLEMVRRISIEIDHDVIQLGVDGRQIALQLEELLGDNQQARRLIVLDYLASEERPTPARVEAALDTLDELSDADLLHLNELARTFGYAHSIEVLDSPVAPRGYRLLSQVPRLQFAQIDRLVGAFGTLQSLLTASSADVQSVDGIGGVRARHITEGLSRLAESKLEDQF